MLDPRYFIDHQDTVVGLAAANQSVEARIVEVTVMERIEGQERERFSVILEGPLEPCFDQQICEVGFADGENHSLFVVPLGPRGEAMRYELVFT